MSVVVFVAGGVVVVGVLCVIVSVAGFAGMCVFFVIMIVRAIFSVNVFVRFVRGFCVVIVRTIFVVPVRVFFFVRVVVCAVFAVFVVMFFGVCGNAPRDGGEEKCGNFEKIFLFHGNNIF